MQCAEEQKRSSVTNMRFVIFVLMVCGVVLASGCKSAAVQGKFAPKSEVINIEKNREIVVDENGEWLISIEGVVDRPGNYRVKKETKLMRLLALAGVRGGRIPLPHSA